MTIKKADVGKEIANQFIAGLESLLSTAKAGGVKAVKQKHTLRSIPLEMFVLPKTTVRDIVEARTSLGVSQPVFAAILGVAPQSVKAWEQGTKKPPGTVRRLIDEMRRNPQYWLKRFDLVGA